MPRGPFHATPIFVAEGRGALLTDVDGNRLLGFAGSIGCVNVGVLAFRRSRWKEQVV